MDQFLLSNFHSKDMGDGQIFEEVIKRTNVPCMIYGTYKNGNHEDDVIREGKSHNEGR